MEISTEAFEQMKTDAYHAGFVEGQKFASKFQHNRYITILENELKQWGTGTMAYTLIMRCILLLSKDRKDSLGEVETNGED